MTLPTANELYEMGWNDVLANYRCATNATPTKKAKFLKKLAAGHIALPRYDREYVRGVEECAQAILDGAEVQFKGPFHVVRDLEERCLTAP